MAPVLPVRAERETEKAPVWKAEQSFGTVGTVPYRRYGTGAYTI